MNRIPPQILYCFRHPAIRTSLLILCFGGMVRSLPYLAPIHAEDIQQKDVAFEFSDRNNLPLGTVLSSNQNHTAIVRLSQVSPDFINGIIAAEDKRYYQHGAVDSIALIRSILEAFQAKQIVSGASTITMQLARLLEPAPRTLPNKFSEIWLSWRLTAGMNQQEILEAYINRLPMGGNLYGVEAAAKIYFNTSASELNLAQASLLAALPNDPTDLNPYHNLSALKKRQNYVLKRMVEDGYITSIQAERAYQEKLAFQPQQQGIIAAPHFLFWLTEQLTNSEVMTHKVEKSIHNIKTTIDRPLQQFIEAQIQQILSSLKDHNVHHAAAIVLDNNTGEVLAYVGSPDYFNSDQLGRNDGVQALRQPGSTLKPFLYELALAEGIIQPYTILADVPTYYAIPGAKLYSPTDYSETFLGPVRVRVALANSLNVPAVKVLEKVTVPVFLERLKQLGFQHLTHSHNYYGLGLTLGSGEVSLWELAQAYLIMANQGKIIKPNVMLSRIKPQNNNSQSIDTVVTWQLITNILSDAHARSHSFGIDSVLNLPFPVAVKTGTSSNYRDTWTVGFTTDYTVATWVGNFDGEGMQNVSGVTGAAPLWNRILLHLHETKEPGNFPKPEGLVELPICATTGLRPTEDCSGGTVLEYFNPKAIPEYYKNSPQFALNSEYNEWLSRQPHPQLTQHQLKIISPQPDDYFVMNSGDASQLEFKIINPSQESVEWWLNGNKLKVQSANSLFWQLQPGQWTLTVKQGTQQNTVQFQVQIADKKPYRRGFSVVNTNK
ncbi:Penicillin-binding protein 2D [Planktothrix tepida]|uniref:Penicillin-binding protein 2 n=1 Tax=Planktothrix tepida PCC 9214 TaxID=671072 RepID=A0A1J1LHJ2_9CYAN|nr:penicillin-binding protein 1C [Planktothrix tepida]CAD5911162.1 Penicillin-binding protein 2D [Planktothrix tepida]CUR32077.1 Penicillin-binding protein 2 [Planktothrix tepida PCC 9214]